MLYACPALQQLCMRGCDNIGKEEEEDGSIPRWMQGSILGIGLQLRSMDMSGTALTDEVRCVAMFRHSLLNRVALAGLLCTPLRLP